MKNHRPSLHETWHLLNADLRRRSQLEGRQYTLWQRLRMVMRGGGLGVVLFRFLDYADSRGWRLVHRLLHYALYFLTRQEIHAGARIGPGLVLPDIGGVGIPAFCEIGSNCTFTGPALLTVGGMEGIDLSRDRILLGDDCVIGHNVRLLGAIELVNETQVKSGSVVITSSDKEGALLSGIPARRRKQLPAKSLKSWNPLKGQPLNTPGDLNMARQSLLQTFRLIREDMAYRCEYEHKPNSLLTVIRMLFNPGMMSVVMYRWQVFFATHWLIPLAKLIEYLNLVLLSVAIDSRAQIAGGLVIIHSHSIYISARVVIGRNCLLFHQNSIGFSPFFTEEGQDTRGPIIGDNVIVGAGASIFGPVTIGSGTKIAVNTAVDSDCPENSVLFGVPARQVAKS